MSPKCSKGITHLKSAHGKPGSGVVATHPDGRGAFAVGDSHTEAVAQMCDDLGLSKARIIGGRYAKDASASAP